MKWDEHQGNEKATRVLREAIREGRIGHAYLFAGPEGAGKEELAGIFAATLLCSTNGPCGICPHCIKVAAKAHPDLHWIEPEGKSIKIEQVRKLKRTAYLRPHEGGFQVFVLTDAHLLTAEAANSLLKVLEEPPATSLFILVAENPEALLPTVVSRCQVISLQRLAEETVAFHSKECNQEVEALLTALSDKSDVAQQLDRLAEKEELPAICDLLLLTLRDVLILQTTGQKSLLTEGRDAQQLQPYLAQWSTADLLEAMAVFLKLQKDLQSPVNVRLALESAVRRLKEVLVNADRCRYPL